MAKLLRWTTYLLGAIAGLFVIAAALVWLVSSAKLSARAEAKPEHLASPTAAQLADAERRARTLGCFSCHGEGLLGRKMFDQPGVATIWAPNITHVAAHASDEQLARAIRQGIGVDGRSLFIMPSEVFQNFSDQEVAALIAAVRRQPRGGTETPSNSFGPLGRLGIVMGKFKSAPQLIPEYATQEPIPAGAQFEPGRRLAIMNCSGCHGAALMGMEVKPGESSPDLMIVGAYDLPAFTRLLRSGVPAGGQQLPLMGPTARSDLSRLTDSEIEMLHGYLQARAQRLAH